MSVFHHCSYLVSNQQTNACKPQKREPHFSLCQINLDLPSLHDLPGWALRKKRRQCDLKLTRMSLSDHNHAPFQSIKRRVTSLIESLEVLRLIKEYIFFSNLILEWFEDKTNIVAVEKMSVIYLMSIIPSYVRLDFVYMGPEKIYPIMKSVYIHYISF